MTRVSGLLAVVAFLGVALLPTNAAAQSLDGTWVFELTAAEGGHSFEVTLEIDGESITGTVPGDEQLTGTVSDEGFELSGQHYIDQAGYSGALNISGKLDGEEITGDASWEGFPLSLTGRRAGDS